MILIRMLTEASKPQLEELAALLKSEMSEECLCRVSLRLYESMYGKHFNEWSLEDALSGLENEDGSVGAHWTLEQTSEVAKTKGIELGKGYNQYDWCYAMNMAWSDYHGAVTDDVSSYARIAKRFLEDRDAPPGKAFRYWMAMR